ncbi:hypothetical protein GCM10020331_081880 [Ectobacillus funiculus]
MAITAGCAFVSQWSAIIIGAISGVIVIYATLFVDNMKIDDPVGAVAVHGANGLFGTIAVGLFDMKEGLLTTGHTSLILVQLLGAVVVAVWGFAGGTFIAKLAEKNSWSSCERRRRRRRSRYVSPWYPSLQRFGTFHRYSC